MMLGYNNYPSRTHHLHNHFSPTRNRQQLDDNNSNITHDYSGSSSFYPTTPTSQQHFDDDTLRAAAASAIGINSQSLNQVPDLMPSESWMVHSQHTPTAAQRFGHQRESSLSSLGSNGPASPYNHNLSNPQIAVTDSGSDGYHELNSGDGAYSYRPSKSVADNFYTSALANYNNRSHHRNSANNGHTAILDMGFHDGVPNLSPSSSSPAQQKLRSDRGLVPAPELSAGGGSSTVSHPVSVASSAADGDSPHTPSLQEPEDHARRRKNGLLNPPPKLDRTLTDIYTDELYNPNFTLTSASPPQTVAMSPTNDIFAQRLQAANSHHLSAAQSPESGISRERSPFRQGSPYASTVNDFSQIGMNQVRLGSAQQMREKRKAERDSREIQQQLARNAARQQGTPNTISPKDAVLDFNDTDDASNFPLFPPQEASAFNNLDSMNNNHNGAAPQQQSNQQFRSMSSATPVQSAFDFSVPANIQMPQQYPFIPRPQQEHHQQPATPSNFSRVSSAEASTPDYGDGSVQKPSRTTADGGTYTCTYHGCTLRFETPALLQKHKREGHRQAGALNAVRDSPVGGMTSSLFNSQAGPHKCERINPSTGKPCNTIFSRPYDLTRHEDTIHNARKQKVRCDLCTEEKTFSRADALTRHYRVCHPDVEFPGKQRRRGGGIP